MTKSSSHAASCLSRSAPPRGPSAARQHPRPLGATDAGNGFYEYLPPGYPAGELWPLLVKITACKAYGELQRAGAQKRGGLAAREVPLFDLEDGSAAAALASDEPTPEFAVQVAEECALLLGKLADPLLVRIAELKLAGHTSAEIADELELCERSIERKLNCIRAKWSEEGSA